MGTIAAIVGSGAGAIIIGVSFIAMGHLGRLPGGIQPWVRRLLIIAMYAGGCTLAVTEIGTLWAGLANRIAGLFGGLDTGLPRVVVVLAAAVLLAGVVVGLIWAPNDAVILTAAFLPAVLMLVPGGFLLNFFTVTSVPAQALADSFNVWIAG
jgi:hypothetical protein